MMLIPFPLNLIREPSVIFISLVNILNSAKGWTGLLFAPLLLIGLWTDLRSSSTGLVRILFLAFYAAIILLYPLQDIRFFLPAVPFVLIALAQGVRTVLRFLPGGRQTIKVVAVVIVALVNLTAVYELLRSNQQYSSAVADHRSGKAPFSASGYYATPWQLAGEALCAATDADVVVAGASKEIVPFVEGRKVLEVNRAVPLPMFEAMLREHNVGVLLVQQVRSGIRSHEIQMSESGRFRFDTIAATGWLTAYRVHNTTREGLAPEHLKESVDEPLVQLLHEARRALRSMDHRRADSLLTVAIQLDPVNAEFAYQRVAVQSLAGDLPGAVQAQQLLFSTPRTTSYIPAGRVLLAIAQFLDASRGLRGTSRAQMYFQAGRAAWDLGYPNHATAFTDSALAADPQHFEALLWGTNYSYQIGDTLRARLYLQRLTKLEAENTVVVGFREIDDLSRSLRQIADEHRRADMYLKISEAYQRIGLPEEAMDAADRAWGALPLLARARTAEILDATGRTVGAKRYRVKN